MIRKAYAFAGNLNPDETSYFECHGTGTPVGDPIELNGITNMFLKDSKRDSLLIGAVKTNVGHAEAASAMASIMKVVLGMEIGVIPASIGVKKYNPKSKDSLTYNRITATSLTQSQSTFQMAVYKLLRRLRLGQLSIMFDVRVLTPSDTEVPTPMLLLRHQSHIFPVTSPSRSGGLSASSLPLQLASPAAATAISTSRNEHSFCFLSPLRTSQVSRPMWRGIERLSRNTTCLICPLH